jgi:ketosteroid isomerase-like protein
VTPLEVVRAFVGSINGHDVDDLAAIMTEDHRFIDSLGHVVRGREAVRAGWDQYFSMVRDYRLLADEWFCDGLVVVLLGTAEGNYSPDGALDPARNWTTPAACRAVTRGGQVAEWRVYADNEPIRQLMRSQT